MLRFEDWPARLNRFIESRATRAFEWGTHDCSLFAADCVLELIGIDPAKEFRGKYSTEAGAYRALLTGTRAYETFDTAVDGIAADIGFAEVPPLTAQRGDVVLIDSLYPPTPTGRPALGVVHLDGRIAAAGADGLVFLPLAAAKRAWRI